MIYIAGVISGFILFPVVCICAILIYGYIAGWDKPVKSEQVPKGNVKYLREGKTLYVDKREINEIINKAKMS